MSSFEKIVKLACKPKNDPPKSKYIDSIIAATWSEDGAIHDVCKALAPRFREPNSVVVFKALIVLHTMIRNGATDNILSHLAQADTLRLRNVSGGNWEGFANPDHLNHYAQYLDCRIRSYRDLKHDVIKVQSETNRDLRSSTTPDEVEHGYNRKKKGAAAQTNPSLGRSKTMMGRKLRSMTVEKGLLRETKVVHSMIDMVVECRFYLDGVDDELRLSALRMLVKDMLILFQAGNEAVINLLEQYFEMSHVDATEALAIYRHFCKQTEHVTEYLGVAKKLQNLLNVPIPNLRHAPLSLATALQEYLDDPNFEQNRLEYKANRSAADGKTPSNPITNNTNAKSSSSSKPEPKTGTITFASSTASHPAASSTSQQPPKNEMDDFFNSIEENQTTMFHAQAPSPTAAPNPFAQMAAQQFVVPQITTQPTGFLLPQQTAIPNPANPFGFPGQQQPFIQQQNFLQPQPTGINPFRQSMLMPQTTGMALFGVQGGGMNAPGPLQPPNSNFFPTSNQLQQPMATGFGQSLFSTASSHPQQSQAQQAQQFSQPLPSSASAIPSNSAFGGTQTQSNFSAPQRPASTPLTSFGSATKSNSPPPLKPHMTGTKNPFGPIITPAAPVPNMPTMAELAMMGRGTGSTPSVSIQKQQPGQANEGSSANATTSGFNFTNSALNPGKTDMGSVASSFAFSNNPTTSSPTGASTATGSTFSNSLFGGSYASGVSSQPTSASTTNTSAIAATASLPTGVGNGSSAPLKPQITGFAGLKAFKPTSSFGAALIESLPPIPDSSGASGPATTTPGTNITSAGTGAGLNSSSFATSEFGALNKQQPNFGGSLGVSTPNTGANGFITSPTSTMTTMTFGSTGRATSPTGTTSRLGVGLRPQLTGGGSANPFRASMATGNAPGVSGGFGAPSVPPLPTGFGTGNMFGSMTFTSSGFGNGFGQTQPGANQPQGQPQQGQGASLI